MAGFDVEKVETVLLDAGGVLMVPDPAVLRRLLEPYGVSLDDDRARYAHYAAMAELDRLDRLDWPEVDRHLARTLGVPEDRVDEVVEDLEAAYLSEPWVPIEGAAHALLRLQAAGYRLGIVSNATGTIEAQLATERICSVDGTEVARVEVVVDSHIVGVEKPDPAIFALALSAIGSEPGRCLYLGDTVFFDVRGAGAAGIPVVHADPYRLCRTAGEHPHVASVAELADLLIGNGN
jgi:putative hydrolase of the HAD superfamily